MHAAADLPRRHWLAVDDYYRMAEVGILDAEARVELIDGEIIGMAPPGSAHAATVHYLMEAFFKGVEGNATVLAQNPVRLSRYSEPQPDLALLRRREDFYRERHPQPDDVLLIVETPPPRCASTATPRSRFTHAMASLKCGSSTSGAGGCSATALPRTARIRSSTSRI